jgi:tripartite-type tricarboxylate transporter receptor subunit TctC
MHKKISRRNAIRRALAAVTTAGAAATAPSSRALAQKVGAALGQPVVVENKPGANQMIGIMDVVRSPADGHSMVFCQSVIVLSQLTYSNVPYDVNRDLAPVSLVCSSYAFFVAPIANPARNLKEFIAWAGTQQGLAFGSAGLGSGTHVYGELINQRAGLKMTHVPYKGEVPVIPDLVSGRIQCGFLSGLTALQLAREGKIRILAAIGPGRSPAAPQVPTLGEQGMVDLDGWYGVFAPRGVPAPIVERLSAEFDKAIKDPEIRDKMLTASLGPVGGTPKDFDLVVARTMDSWTRVVKETGVRAE